MKYIIIDNGMFETPIIFDEATDHSEMVSGAMGFKQNVVSAGFVQLTGFVKNGPATVNCYGRSTSLKIGSRLEDTKLINRMLGVDFDDD